MPLRVLEATISNNKYFSIDLSENNKLLQLIDVSSVDELGDYIHTYVESQNGLVAYGGYNEVRSIYKRSTYFNKQGSEERNIHLGVDLWCSSGTHIFAPLEGMVHSFKNNTNHGDYGPTIILKHEIEGVIFYTLYGHLRLESIQYLEIGQVFREGDKIGALGDASINGDYPPHLHFQIIKDLQGLKGDYPGVCSKKDLEFYKQNCPDPNLLLKLDF